MQLPCATCIKFHRADKCHELPPHPPSEEELSKINQRKLIYKNRKRKREEVDTSPSQDHNSYPMHQLHFLHRIPIQEPMVLTPQMLDPLSIPVPYNAYQIQLPTHHVVHLGPSHQQHQHQLRLRQHQQHLQAQQLQIQQHPQLQLEQHLQLQPQLHFQQPSNLHQDMTTTPYSQPYHTQPALPLSPHFANNFAVQLTASNGPSPTNPPWTTSSMQTRVDSSKDRLHFDVDLRDILLYLPKNINYFNSLMDRFTGTSTDGSSDASIIHKTARNIYLQITDSKNQKSTIENWTLDDLRTLSKLFLVLINGLNMSPESYYNSGFLKVNLHSNEATINKWLLFSKTLRDKAIQASLDTNSSKSLDELRKINIKNARFVLEWYLILKSFFHLSNRIHDNFEEFVRAFNFIRENEYAMEFLNLHNFYEKYVLHRFKMEEDSRVLAVSWFKLRMVEVEFPFLQNNGSMFLYPKICDTIVPNDQMSDIVFQRLQFDPTTCSFYEFQTDIWRVYHRNNVSSKESYSFEMIELYMLCFRALNELIKCFRNASCVQEHLLKASEKNLLKTYAAQWVFTRGTLLVKLDERTYFPLLRIASYLTTQMNKFNFFLYLELEQKDREQDSSFIDNYMLDLDIRSYNVSVMYIELMNVLIYLATLTNYLALNNGGNKRRFQLLSFLRTITYERVEKVLECVKRSKVATLGHVGFYGLCSNMIEVILKYIQHVNDFGSFSQETSSRAIMVDGFYKEPKSESAAYELMKYLRTNCPKKEDWQCYIVSIFGARDSLSNYIEQLWETFTFITEKTPNGDIEIVEGLTLNVQLVEKIRNNFLGLEFDENTIKQFVSSMILEKNVIQLHSPFATAQSNTLSSFRIPNK